MHNPNGIKLLKRLRVGLSHLREHKFRLNLEDSINPFCNCGWHIETTIYSLLSLLHKLPKSKKNSSRQN